MDLEKMLLTLGGVAIGVILTILKEIFFNSAKTKKDAQYLCVHVSSLLDRFVWQCVDVLYDDGTDRGRLPPGEYASSDYETPSFVPELLKVEWRSIPTNKMATVLNFPNVILRANRRIRDAFENDSPPLYEDGFAERQYNYALLGIEAVRIANMLREIAGIPIVVEDQADSMRRFSNVTEEYEAYRVEQERLHREAWPRLSQS